MPDVLSGHNMVNSTKVANSNFGQIINSLSYYAEIIVVLMVLILISISFDEIIDFIDLIRVSFVYPAPPVSP